ncbi:hypothetical protein BT63DRAFT_55435 [Microthyrium microscopicum]|uniref:Uncharacterized protein n=1 Tax=Microthyrium microscopicum TaxID=703497 RepID=A0A6A6U3Q0_9PEZI|nr:hypothetical protein BT63DRAFT_55435 [Microthyrium microscopicum]
MHIIFQLNMPSMLLFMLSLLPIVHALDAEPPFSHINNTWYVENIDISRVVNYTGGVKASFSIYRTYYERCLGQAPDGMEKLLRVQFSCLFISNLDPVNFYNAIMTRSHHESSLHSIGFQKSRLLIEKVFL